MHCLPVTRLGVSSLQWVNLRVIAGGGNFALNKCLDQYLTPVQILTFFHPVIQDLQNSNENSKFQYGDTLERGQSKNSPSKAPYKGLTLIMRNKNIGETDGCSPNMQ